MPDQIIIADPSRTVRTLVKLAFQDQPDGLVEAAEPADLEEALGGPGRPLLIVDEAWAIGPSVLKLLSGVSAVLVLGAPNCSGVPWAEALGLDSARVAVTPKPVSRRSVREAADRVFDVDGATPAAAGDLRAMVAEERWLPMSDA